MPWYEVSAAGVLSLNGLAGDVTLAVVGGTIAASGSTLTITVSPGVTTWDALQGKPSVFPPSAHGHVIGDVAGLQTALDSKQAAGSYAPASHTHTAGQVSGLATVATSGSAADLTGTLPDGRLSGNVPLMVGGLIPSGYLPSFVDDVLEFASLASFPGIGETGKIYVAKDTNRTYRWSGSAYVEISASPGSTDAVPEGATNLYFTTSRAAAAAPVQSVAGRTGVVVLAKADVGLGSVDNTADSSKPVSTAQAAADAAVQAYAVQRGNHTGTQAAGTITGLATVATTGAYADLSGAPAAYSLPTATASVLGGVIVGTGLAVSSGTISVSYGTTSSTACAGNDARLSDTRTPTVGTVTDASIATAGLSAGSINWTSITAWAPSTTYAKGDLVEYLGIAYRRAAAGTSGTTFNTANWQQVSPTSFVGSQIASGTVAAARLGAHASTHQTGGADAVSSVVVTPASLTADVNDWAIGTGDVFRVAGTAARNVTGIAAGTSGLAVLLVNVGSFALTLKHQSSSSNAANRFTVPWAGDCVLAANGGAAVLVYDSTSATWRVI